MSRRGFATIIAIAFFYIASPLIFPLIMGGVLAVLLSPWLDRLKKRQISSVFGSAILTVGITVLFILPAFLFIFLALKSALPYLKNWKKAQVLQGSGVIDTLMHSPRIQRVLEWLSTRIPTTIENLGETFQEFATNVGMRLTEHLGEILSHLPMIAVGVLVIILSTYFFLVDGKKLVFFIKRNSILAPQETDRLIRTVAEMCRSVILASLVSGGVQAFLEKRNPNFKGE